MKNISILMLVFVAIVAITSCKQPTWIRASKPVIDSIIPERLPEIQYAVTGSEDQIIVLTRPYFEKFDTVENGILKTKSIKKQITQVLKPLTHGVLLMSRDIKDENNKFKKLFLITVGGDSLQLVFGPDDSKTGLYVLYYLDKDGKYSFSKNLKERKIKFGSYVYDVSPSDIDPKTTNWSVNLFLLRENVESFTVTKNIVQGASVGTTSR